jgi:hypothetical protein
MSASGNVGYVTSVAATGNPSGAATLNSESGKVTSPALTAIEGAGWVLTLTNSLIGAGSRIEATVGRGTGTAGYLIPVQVNAAAGGATIVVLNLAGQGGATANGTYTVDFVVHN